MKKVIFLIALFVSMGASASSPINQNTIKALVIHDFGNEVIVYTDGFITNQEGCQLNNAVVLVKTHPFFKEIFSALLATYHSGGKFSGWVNGCNGTSGGAPILIRLDLNK